MSSAPAPTLSGPSRLQAAPLPLLPECQFGAYLKSTMSQAFSCCRIFFQRYFHGPSCHSPLPSEAPSFILGNPAKHLTPAIHCNKNPCQNPSKNAQRVRSSGLFPSGRWRTTSSGGRRTQCRHSGYSSTYTWNQRGRKSCFLAVFWLAV